jgi:hypothetical protein
MPKRLVSIACLGLLVWGCASGTANTIRYETGVRALATDDGLHRIRAPRTDTLYVRPGATLADYDRFMIVPVDVFYREPPAGTLVNEFQPRERERFERMVRRELSTAFGRDETLSESDAPGPGVLRLRVQFVDLSLGVPRRAPPGQDRVWTTTEFRLFLDVSDSVSGQSLLRMVDYRLLNPTSSGPPLASAGVAHPGATNVTVMEENAAIRNAVGNRARALQEAFDRVRSAGTLPLPDSFAS